LNKSDKQLHEQLHEREFKCIESRIECGNDSKTLHITSQRNHKQETNVRNTRTQNSKLKIHVTVYTS